MDDHAAIIAAVARRYAWLADRLPSLGLDDLRQEAAFAIWRYDAAHPGEPAGSTLACTIARRAVLDAIRAARPRTLGRPALPLEDVDATSRDPDPAVAIDVRDQVARLTPALRTAVVRRMEGWSGAAAAAADGISPKTVETRITRAGAALRAGLSDYAPRPAKRRTA